MQEVGAHRVHPALKELVVTASRALAKLDADRLEELAVSCQALNRDLVQTGSDEHVALKQQSGDAAREMAVFARILEATRANLTVAEPVCGIAGRAAGIRTTSVSTVDRDGGWPWGQLTPRFT